MIAGVAELDAVLLPFAPVFSQPVWQHAQVLIVGAILTLRQRTVTACLRAAGRRDERHFTNYHRVLNRARWDPKRAAKILLGLLVALLPPSWPVVVLVDETIERRNGPKIGTKGVFRDAVRSSRKKVVYCFGLRWIAMMLAVPLPWSRRVWALPFLTVQAPSRRANENNGKRHKTVIDWTCQMLSLVRRWVPDRVVVLVGDGAYAAMDLLRRARALPGTVILVARFRWDAALYDPPPPPVPGKRGPKPKKGKRQPSLSERAEDPTSVWKTVWVRWYEGVHKHVCVLSGVSLWYQSGKPPIPIRWVIVRDPEGKFEDTPLLCSDLEVTEQQIIEWFVLRWNIEVTFEDCRAHLGLETQRQWSDQAIARTTPCLFGLFSLITLTAAHMVKDTPLPIVQTAWYRKTDAAFSDVIALVRRHIWTARYYAMSSSSATCAQFQDDIVFHLIEHLSNAA
jgi:hypothetical protein